MNDAGSAIRYAQNVVIAPTKTRNPRSKRIEIHVYSVHLRLTNLWVLERLTDADKSGQIPRSVDHETIVKTRKWGRNIQRSEDGKGIPIFPIILPRMDADRR
jgi:hypothetical protein